MNQIKHHRRTRRSAPQGMATLEFAMALPFILLFMVGITWLAYSVIGKAEVLVQARNDAWRERFKNLADRPLVFPSGIGGLRNTFYPGDKDYVSKTVNKKVNVSRIFDGVAGPSASVTVLAGSWDHRAMNLNDPPNFKLYLIAAANAVTKELQTEIGKLGSLIDKVQSDGAIGIAQAIASGDDAASSANNAQSAGESGSSEAEKEKEDKKKEIQEQQGKLGGIVDSNPLGNHSVLPINGGQLDQTNDEITRLELDLAAKRRVLPLKDEKQEKERLEEIAREDRQLQLLKDKKQRIEAEIRDNDEELKGFK